MIGTIVNTISIITGCTIGSITKKGIKEEYQNALFNAIGLCAFCLGVATFSSSLPNSKYPVLFIVSMAIGTIIGTFLDLDGKFNKVTSKMGGSDFSILGPVQSALYGNNTFLFTNAALDFVTSIILSCAYGIGIMWAAFVLFIWQGSIYAISLFLGEYISQNFFNELSIVGGILILSSGIGILKIKEMKTVNMLPSLFIVPILWFLVHIVK